MGKTEITKLLEKQLYRTMIKRGVFGTFEVTLGWYGRERVDFMTYDCKGVFRCYEVKVSVSDFHSKAKHSFVGHYNYYVMPYDLYRKVLTEVPDDIGIYVGEENGFYDIGGKRFYRELTCVKKPKKRELGMDKDILFGSLIRCLHRDAEKYNTLEGDLLDLENMKRDYESQIRHAERNAKLERDGYIRLLHDLHKIYGDEWEIDFRRKQHALYEEEWKMLQEMKEEEALG